MAVEHEPTATMLSATAGQLSQGEVNPLQSSA